MTKGFNIATTSGGTDKAINFTYLSYGAMGSGNNGAYGLLAALRKESGDAKIDFSYKNLSGTAVSGGSVTIEGEPGGYKVVPAAQSGETYVVVAKSGGNYYALTTEKYTIGSIDYLKGSQVTVSGDYIASSVGDDILWKLTTDGDGFNVMNLQVPWLWMIQRY